MPDRGRRLRSGAERLFVICADQCPAEPCEQGFVPGGLVAAACPVLVAERGVLREGVARRPWMAARNGARTAVSRTCATFDAGPCRLRTLQIAGDSSS